MKFTTFVVDMQTLSLTIRKGLVFVFALLVSILSWSQEKGSGLLVYGDGFQYGIETPEGWIADTTSSNDLYVNVAFHEKRPDLYYEKTIITVYAFKKESARLLDDLNADIVSFKEEHKKANIEDFTIAHPDFKCYSTLMYVKDSTFQYQIYADPGKKFESGVAFSMVGPRRATEAHMRALRKLVSSLRMIKG